MPISKIDLEKYKSPNMHWDKGADYHEWYPRIKDLTPEQILESLQFDEIERFVRKKKLENIKKDK